MTLLDVRSAVNDSCPWVGRVEADFRLLSTTPRYGSLLIDVNK